MNRLRDMAGGKKNMMKILLFSRKTVYGRAFRENRDRRIKKLILANHRSVKRLRRADEEHEKTLEEIKKILAGLGVSFMLVYDFRREDPERYDLVVTVGGDGTVLFASHHLHGTPLLGINSSPSNSAGYLTSASRKNLRETLERLSQGRIKRSTLHRLAAYVDGKLVHDRVLNDVLFTSDCPAVTARYFLRVREITEEQMSSGLWIGPAAGSTAALLSAGGKVMRPGSKKIQYVVREPMEKGRRYRLKKGIVGEDEEVVVVNKWQRSELYIDGPHKRMLIQPGQEVTVKSSSSPLVLLGWR